MGTVAIYGSLRLYKSTPVCTTYLVLFDDQLGLVTAQHQCFEPLVVGRSELDFRTGHQHVGHGALVVLLGHAFRIIPVLVVRVPVASPRCCTVLVTIIIWMFDCRWSGLFAVLTSFLSFFDIHYKKPGNKRTASARDSGRDFVYTLFSGRNS